MVPINLDSQLQTHEENNSDEEDKKKKKQDDTSSGDSVVDSDEDKAPKRDDADVEKLDILELGGIEDNSMEVKKH